MLLQGIALFVFVPCGNISYRQAGGTAAIKKWERNELPVLAGE